MTAQHTLSALLLDPFLTVGEAERECGTRCQRVRTEDVRSTTARPLGYRPASVQPEAGRAGTRGPVRVNRTERNGPPAVGYSSPGRLDTTA